jgi:hypothetical protein
MSKTLYIERGESGITIRRKDGSYFCCCDTEDPTCCMYPADKLGIDYTTADLPDNLSLNWSDTDVVTVDKVGSGYAGGTVSILIENEKWVLRNTATGNARTIGRCLIREDDLVADQFADCYEVDSSGWSDFGVSVDIICPKVIRENLCNWGRNSCDGDLWFELSFHEPTQKWRVFGWYTGFQVATGIKTGNQNSPVGTYTGNELYEDICGDDLCYVPSGETITFSISETTCP